MLNTELATSLILRSHGRHTVTCNAKNANILIPNLSTLEDLALFQEWQNQTAGDEPEKI